jgi:hypothetical protein
MCLHSISLGRGRDIIQFSPSITTAQCTQFNHWQFTIIYHRTARFNVQIRPTASSETEALIRAVIDRQFKGVVDLPAQGEEFSDVQIAFQRVQWRRG